VVGDDNFVPNHSVLLADSRYNALSPMNGGEVMAENFVETVNGIRVNGDNPECKGRTAWKGSEIHLWDTLLPKEEVDLLNTNVDPKTIQPEAYLGSSKDWKITQLKTYLDKYADHTALCRMVTQYRQSPPWDARCDCDLEQDKERWG